MNTYNAYQIAAVLFNLDPMSTACVQNGLTQEYQVEANHIASTLNSYLLVDNNKITNLIKQVFDYYFWNNCLTQQQLEEIANEISKLGGVH